MKLPSYYSSIVLILTLYTATIMEQIVHGQTTLAPVDPNFECPGSGLFPVSDTYCLSFYYACFDDYTAYILECPDDLVFDPTSRACKTYDEIGQSCREKVCLEPDGNFPVPGEVCSRVYIQCVAGDPFDSLCPSVSVFDPDRLLCTSPENVVGCPSYMTTPNISTTTEGTTKPPGFEGCKGKPDGSYPDPDDCNVYHVCISGVDFPTTCPPSSCFVVTGPGIGYCDAFGGCLGKPDGKYPDPGNCNEYHVCISGTDFPSSCSQGACFIVTGPGEGCCKNQQC